MTLPVYYTLKKSKKKVLIGLNEMYKMHHMERAELIGWFKSDIKRKLGSIKLTGKIKTHYIYYYKNKASDASNVISVIDKMFMDALQEHGTILQDNVTHYIKSEWEVGGLDKNNPRVEVKIFEVS